MAGRHGAVRPGRPHRHHDVQPPPGRRRLIYFTSLVLSRHDATKITAITEGGYIVAIFTASASWFVLLAISGVTLRRFITGQRGQAVTGVIFSLVIGALAMNALLSA